MIKVDIRSKRFGVTPVLGPIRFDVAPGQTVALVGPSGIGKSTLLRIVAGIDTRFDGDVFCPERLAMVFQEPTLLPWRSVHDNLSCVHPQIDQSILDQALTRVGLAGKEDLFPGQLSLGQQRRLSLARAFVGKPQMLVLDEPFVSLDPETAQSMLELTRELIADTQPATLFVTHDAREAAALNAQILRLETGANGAIIS